MWETIKKVFNFITSVILYSVLVLLVIIGLMVGAYFIDHHMSIKQGNERAPLFGAYVIISPSMEPTIHVLDAVVTMRVRPESIKKGDVITFISNDPDHPGITITHRVMGIQETTRGSYAYKTKGDANNVEDDTWASYDNVIGKVMLRIPSVGKLQRLLLSRTGWLFLIVLPCLLIIVSDIVKVTKVAISGAQTEENKEQLIVSKDESSNKKDGVASSKNNKKENKK